ncbi:MAG: VCBS repeat-containing protein, partial [Caldiserica bacterium]|nr:VCBS repeat-containing protein [Caldisericota bacterium]
MKQIRVVIAILVAVAGFSSASAEDGKKYDLQATLTIEPGQSATVSVVDGLLKVEGQKKPEVPSIVNSSPEWLRYDLELAFSKLAKSPERVGKEAYAAFAKIDGKETLVLSASGKKPYILGLPGYDDLSSMLPANIDPTARIAITDVDSDGNVDLVVCPKNKGYYYLLGPDFSVSTKSGNIEVNPEDAKKPLYPIGFADGTVKLLTEPKEFGFWDLTGDYKTCKQENFVMPLPKAYGVMTSMGLFYIDGSGDLRLFDARLTGVKNDIPSGFSAKTEEGLPSFDSETHLAFDKNKIYAGSLDGSLKSMEYSKTGWKVEPVKTKLSFGTKLSIQVANGNLYFLDSKSKNIQLAKGSDWTKAEKLNVTSDTPFAATDVNGDKNTDMAVISSNKLTIFAGPDFKTALKTVEEWVERKKNDKETEKVSLIDNGSSPAFADFNFDGKTDLLIGLRDGRILSYAGPNFDKVDTFDWLDAGDFAAPQFGDVDLDGKA